MPYVKYTREILAEAVTASTSMAGVLRFLGLRVTGGAHAHLRRRIDQFGIDTSHFLGFGHARGSVSPRRRLPGEILVLRPAEAKRQAPTVLRRALEESGREYRCAECGIGDVWNGRPLTLQVDHIDGQFRDCRTENLRFLCPNCHTQTSTYAGRNRPRVRMNVTQVDELGRPVGPVAVALSQKDKITVLERVGRGEMTVTDAARALLCHPSQVYALLRRLAERGSPAPAPAGSRVADKYRNVIIAFAVAHPNLGRRRIAAALKEQQPEPITVSASTIDNVLKSAGLQTRAARVAAGAVVPRATV